MRQVTIWIVAMSYFTLLIAMPRGGKPAPGKAQITTPILTFSWSQYRSNVADLFHRIFTLHPGDSQDGQNIMSLLGSGLTTSLILIGLGVIFVLLIGVTKGIYDGRNSSQLSGGVKVSLLTHWIFESLPDFFLILSVELLGFYLLRHGINIYFVGSNQFFSGTLVPSLILALGPSMYMARVVRLNVADQFGQQYVITAYAKGLSKRRIIARHILPNTVGTILIALMPCLGMLLSNLVLVEYLFYKKGLVAGFFNALGQSGFAPVFGPPQMSNGTLVTTYAPYDPILCFGYLFICFVLVSMLWGAIRLCLSALGYRMRLNPYSGIAVNNGAKVPWQLTVGAVMFFVPIGLNLSLAYLPLPSPRSVDVLETAHHQLLVPPFPPSIHHLLGTDTRGHDLLSQTINGTLPTIEYLVISVVLILTFAIALALASAVFRVRFVRTTIELWYSCTAILPGVVAALLVFDIPLVYWTGLRYDVNTGNSYWSTTHVYVYIAILCFVECGKVAKQLQMTLDEGLQKEYLIAAETLGNSTWTKFLLHLFPSFCQMVTEQLLVESSRILMLIATLGFFHYTLVQNWVYIGPLNSESFNGWLFAVNSVDWGGLLSQNARNYLSSSWVLFAPALFVTWTVISLNLMLLGARRKFQFTPSYSNKRSIGVRFQLVAPSGRQIWRDV